MLLDLTLKYDIYYIIHYVNITSTICTTRGSEGSSQITGIINY